MGYILTWALASTTCIIWGWKEWRKINRLGCVNITNLKNILDFLKIFFKKRQFKIFVFFVVIWKFSKNGIFLVNYDYSWLFVQWIRGNSFKAWPLRPTMFFFLPGRDHTPSSAGRSCRGCKTPTPGCGRWYQQGTTCTALGRVGSMANSAPTATLQTQAPSPGIEMLCSHFVLRFVGTPIVTANDDMTWHMSKKLDKFLWQSAGAHLMLSNRRSAPRSQMEKNS